MEVRHVFPIGDDRPHEHHALCPCGPDFVEGDGYDVVLHHFFDRREFIIAIEVFLKLRCPNCLEFIDEKGVHLPDPPPYDETKGQ